MKKFLFILILLFSTNSLADEINYRSEPNNEVWNDLVGKYHKFLDGRNTWNYCYKSTPLTREGRFRKVSVCYAEEEIDRLKKYNLLLKDLSIELPLTRGNCTHVSHLFVIKVDKRDRLKEYLEQNGVNTTIQYPVPIHKQNYYQKMCSEKSLPVTEQIVKNILSLPMYPELEEKDMIEIASVIKDYYS